MSCCTTPATVSAGTEERTTTYRPRLDVIERAEDYLAIVEIPGAGKEDVEIVLEDGLLSLRAKVADPTLEGRTWRRREYGTGDFARTLRIGDAIDADRIEADVKNGVLTVVLPKAEAVKPRTIRIG